ncbi:MAG: glycosyltransferase, partial [Candidatus Omnitrophota bacterium]|nr:glycosyltransferase [Candidatus Omnitrophota bacterium]
GGMRDIDIILDFFKKRCSLDRYCLLIAGGGPLKNRLEAMIREKYGIKNYIITGTLAQNEMPRYISAMDACFVYMRENIGNDARVSLKLLEYLAMERIVFGKVVGQTNSILGKYVSDFDLFEPDSLERLTESRKADLEEARDVIKEKYSMESLKISLGELLSLVQKCR